MKIEKVEIVKVMVCGEEVTKVHTDFGFDFYMNGRRDQLVIAKGEQAMFKITADCNQNFGFIDEIVSYVIEKHGRKEDLDE